MHRLSRGRIEVEVPYPLKRLGGHEDSLACATSSLHIARNRAHSGEFSIYLTVAIPLLGDISPFTDSFLPRPDRYCHFDRSPLFPAFPAPFGAIGEQKYSVLLPSNLLLGVHHPLDLPHSFDYTSNGEASCPIP